MGWGRCSGQAESRVLHVNGKVGMFAMRALVGLGRGYETFWTGAMH